MLRPGSIADIGPDTGTGAADRSVLAVDPTVGPGCAADSGSAAGGTGRFPVRSGPGVAATGRGGVAVTAAVDSGGAGPATREATGVDAGPATRESAFIDAVDAFLPQTQCRRCGYDACRPYAEALVRGKAGINRCPPGGDATVAALARVLGLPVVPLDPACGAPGPRESARIVESECIGCTVCIRACPVDAIIGARKWMHAVLESECTGCGLCVEPCPVDCIAMVPARTGPVTPEAWLAERAPLARRRFERRRTRESALDAAPHRREQAPRMDAAASLRRRTVEQRRADIAAAVARAEARRAQVKAWDGERRIRAPGGAGRCSNSR